MEYQILTVIGQLDDIADQWDALCQQDTMTSPSSSVGAIQLWYRHFAAGRCFRAVLVRDRGHLVGALPLIEDGKRGLLRWGMLLENHWAQHGALLIDGSTDPQQVSREIVKAFGRLPWSSLWLRCLSLEHPAWQALTDACTAAGQHILIDPKYDAGRFHMARPFEERERTWSRNFRRRLRRAMQRGEAEGGVALERFPELGEHEVEPLLREGFEIENRSWKGQAGTSVLGTPGMFAFFLAQAQLMARQGCLELLFLRHGQHRIAFVYAWRVGSTYYYVKIAYDPQFAHLSPGLLLEYLHHQHLASRDEAAILDTAMGKMSKDCHNFGAEPYTVGSLLIPIGNPGGQLLTSGYRLYRGWKRFRKRDFHRSPR